MEILEGLTSVVCGIIALAYAPTLPYSGLLATLGILLLFTGVMIVGLYIARILLRNRQREERRARNARFCAVEKAYRTAYENARRHRENALPTDSEDLPEEIIINLDTKDEEGYIDYDVEEEKEEDGEESAESTDGEM